MKTTYQFKLIDGKFSPAAAGEVLFSLISSKLQYHEMELFSNQERFAKDLQNSKKRINDLKNIRSSLQEIISKASTDDPCFKINGYIEVILDQE